MAKAKRPPFKINDRVTIASYTPLVPAYGGKPFVGRETVLRVSSVTGTGSQRNPYFVHVTDGGHFWQFPPDDIVLAEEGTRHATKKSPAQLDREIAEALATRGEDPAHRVVFGSPEHNLIRAREVLADGLPHITSPGDPLYRAFQKLRSLKEATVSHLSGGDYAVKTTDKSRWNP
jgi:hypothetical protein